MLLARKSSSKYFANLSKSSHFDISSKSPLRRLSPVHQFVRRYSQNGKSKSNEVERDLILSVLESQPTARDSRSYLKAFTPTPPTLSSKPSLPFPLSDPVMPTTAFPRPHHSTGKPLDSLFEDLTVFPNSPSRIGVVVIQGPFDDSQLKGIVEGVIHLKKLGLGSVVLVDHEDWEERIRWSGERRNHDRRGHFAIPSLFPPLRDHTTHPSTFRLLPLLIETSILFLIPHLRFQRPLLSHPSFPSTLGLVLFPPPLTHHPYKPSRWDSLSSSWRFSTRIHKSRKRDVVHRTYLEIRVGEEEAGEPEAVGGALKKLPRESSALVLGPERGGRRMVGNLVTGKPVISPSLRLGRETDREREADRDNPTIVRLGYPIRVIRSMEEVDRSALTSLLEGSFGRILKQEYWTRLEKCLEFIIVVGDYKACAIVTLESHPSHPTHPPISYLDKFAVLPSLQGEGTVDFLWGALRDESFGLGAYDSLNPNLGGLQGQGESKDLVWRSRANNLVNKWYFERSNGSIKIPPPEGSDVGFVLFWCDAEDGEEKMQRLLEACGDEEERERLLDAERGKLQRWEKIVRAIPSCWEPKK
ncbi:DUF619-domain-containing protein [Atractiella rhizophila]|nr:DUF619-domain-containing protein [Atractiella rhizophila]